MGKLIKVDFKKKQIEPLILTKEEVEVIGLRLKEIVEIKSLCTDQDNDVLESLSAELQEINETLRENFINSRNRRLKLG